MTFFTADDFNEILMSPYDEKIADISNQKLQREGRIVYCGPNSEAWCPEQREHHNTKALVVCIEPLKKPKCEHDVIIKINLAGAYSATCNRCGAVMQPTKWEPAHEQR